MSVLSTKILIDAARSKAEAQGYSFTFVHKGDPDSGQILLVTYDAKSRKNSILSHERDWENNTFTWVSVKDDKLFDDAELSEYIVRQRQRDPDLWVIEFGGRVDQNPFL